MIFHLPDRSSLRELARQREWKKPTAFDYLPVVYWLDGADGPSIIETVMSHTYYKRTDPRVRVHSFLMRQVVHGAATDPSRHVGWLTKTGADEPCQGL